MARTLSMDMQLELRRDAVIPALFIKLTFPDDGDLNLFTGYGTYTFLGGEYTGAGHMLGVDRVEEAADLRAVGINFTFSGVPAALRSLALNASTNMQGGTASVWLALFWKPTNGTPYELVAEPYRWDYRMDNMIINDDAVTTTIKLAAESELIDLERARARYYTAEDQAIDYPNDTFFDFVPSLQDKQVQWGRNA